MSFVTTMQRALAGESTVKTWWGCSGLTGEAFHQWFRERLDAKINREDRRRWRRLSANYQAALARDAVRLREITRHRIMGVFAYPRKNHQSNNWHHTKSFTTLPA
jgi:hypothetical protein